MSRRRPGGRLDGQAERDREGRAGIDRPANSTGGVGMVYDPRLAARNPSIRIGERVRLEKAAPCGMCGRPSRVQIVVEADAVGRPHVTWCQTCYETYRREQGV